MNQIINDYMNQGVSVVTVETTSIGRLIRYENDWIVLEYKGKETSINCAFIVTIEKHTMPEDKKKK